MGDAASARNGPEAGSGRPPGSRRKLLDAARKLFAARGYHATRPQDISRAAKLGHGTFYLHFRDKRECFLAFVEEARAELHAAALEKAKGAATLTALIEAVLAAVYDYAEEHPGVLNAAVMDEAVISSGGGAAGGLLQRWGEEWAELLRSEAANGAVSRDFDFEIVGQAIVGAIHQASSVSFRAGRSRAAIARALTRLFVRALSPD